MQSKKLPKVLMMAAVAAMSASATSAMAEDIAAFEATPPSTPATVDSNPVITVVLTSPQVIGTRTYSNWAFLAQDSSGSVDVFVSKTNLTTLDPGYSPMVGDTIGLTSTYSPFDQIPETGTISALGKTGTAAAPAPTLTTIPAINTPTLPLSLGGHYLELDNVTINAGTATTFPLAGTNSSGWTITDAANNSMTLFDWTTSYSTDGAMGGNPIPTGPVDITGFSDVFGSGATATAEFTPITITPAVPEPASLGLIAVGGLLLTMRRRRKA